MHGVHILAEFHDCVCGPELLRQVDQIRALCQQACAAGSLTIVAEAFHTFGSAKAPAGVTGAIVLAESHLAIHTWPEIGKSGAVTLDLYVCNFSRDNQSGAEQAFRAIEHAFRPTVCEKRVVIRGAINK